MRLSPSPGATLPADQILGRDPLIERYWNLLRQLSLVLVAPRRMGKSSICRKMCAQPRSGFHPVMRDLQGHSSVEQLLDTLVEDTRSLLSQGTRLKMGAEDLLRKFTGSVEADLVKVKLPERDARKLLNTLMDDLESWGKQNNKTVVLFWDEFTWFLLNMVQRGLEQEAGVLLDSLRAMRQSGRHDHVRLVFTGSIGLEEVLDRLRASGYGNDPFNDTQREVVPVLDLSSAITLAEALLPTGAANLASGLAALCEGHPYFLHRVLAEHSQGPWGLPELERTLHRLLDEEHDPLELRQYVERLQTYYPEQRGVLLGLLDRVAERPRGVDELVELLKIEREQVLTLTSLLRRDLYLERWEGKLRFRLHLLRRFWALQRDLTAQDET